jgi:DNA-binding transcriptional ArsR family regulator
MKLLKQRPMTVTELIGALGVGRGIVYYHLKRILNVQSRLRDTALEFWIGDRDD